MHYTVALERRASRLTTFFRLILTIPHAIVIFCFEIAAFVVLVLAWFAILFTGRHPQGMFRFGERFMRYTARLGAYQALLTDRYPAFGGGEAGDGYPVEYRVDYPERLSRLTTFFRGIMIIPAGIVWYVLNLVTGIMAVLTWFAIVITGRLPQGLAGVLVFCTRYHMRVLTYSWLLTDRYPWFQPASDEIESGPTQVCPSCGRANSADAAFCAACGHSLA